MTEYEAKQIYLKEKNNPENKVTLKEVLQDKALYVVILFAAIFIFIMYSGTQFAGRYISHKLVSSGDIHLSDDGKVYLDKNNKYLTTVNDWNK